MTEPRYVTLCRLCASVPAETMDGRMSLVVALHVGAREERTGKPFGPKTIRRLLQQHTGQEIEPISHETVVSMRRYLDANPPAGAPVASPAPVVSVTVDAPEILRPTETAPPPAEAAESATVAYDVERGTATCELIIPEGMVKDEEGLLRFANVDPERWAIQTMRVRAYGTAMKMTEVDVDGVTHTRPVVVQMAAVKADLKAKVFEPALKALAADLLSDLRTEASVRPPAVPMRRREPGLGNLVVLHAPDLHIGKVPVAGEWDAVAAHDAAVDDLLAKTQYVDTARILLAMGNDALNADGSRNGTTRGTPMPGLGRWRDTFRAAVQMYRRAIDRALDVAPVTVAVVPGNHDGDSVFYLGEVIAETYAANPHVSVLSSAHPRVYHLHGRCLLGLTHGDGCKLTDLPRLMSEEAPAEWAQATAAREWLTGHRHRLEVQTVGSCVIRTSDALSPTDLWHAERGYTGVRRAAEALVYDPEAGRVGVFSSPLHAAHRLAA